MAEYFKMYKIYCANQQTSLSTVDEQSRKSARFRECLQVRRLDCSMDDCLGARERARDRYSPTHAPAVPRYRTAIRTFGARVCSCRASWSNPSSVCASIHCYWGFVADRTYLDVADWL